MHLSADIWFWCIVCKLFKKFDWRTLSPNDTPSHKYSGLSSEVSNFLCLLFSFIFLLICFALSVGVYCSTRHSRWLFFVSIKMHSLLPSFVYPIECISTISRLLNDWDHRTAQVYLSFMLSFWSFDNVLVLSHSARRKHMLAKWVVIDFRHLNLCSFTFNSFVNVKIFLYVLEKLVLESLKVKHW